MKWGFRGMDRDIMEVFFVGWIRVEVGCGSVLLDFLTEKLKVLMG